MSEIKVQGEVVDKLLVKLPYFKYSNKHKLHNVKKEQGSLDVSLSLLR